LKRRDFIKGSFLAGLGNLWLPGLGRGQSSRPDSLPSVRNVIFYCYDGFSWEDFAKAKYFAQRHQGRTLTLERLFALGAVGNQTTHSLTSIVTDSAAASTAWGTGRKIVNAFLGMLPDGRKLTTILELAKEKGKATGLITTTRITHATPAGFSVHVDNRDKENEIAEAYLTLQPDVLLGGGARHFDPAARKDGLDLFAKYRAQGYDLLRTAADLEKTNASRLLGTFTASHVAYEIDRRFQNDPSPSLAQMTRKGLDVLAGYENGFVAQVEAGRIDHANHSNDPGACLWDILAADEALDVILEFIRRHPETLLLLTSDHGTGGGVIFGIGGAYRLTSPTFDKIQNWKASYEYARAQLGKMPSPNDVRDAVRRYTSLELTPDQAHIIVEALTHKTALPHEAAHNTQPDNTYAYALTGGDYDHPERLNISYATGQHTAGPVPLILYGAGITPKSLGMVDNVDCFRWMTDAIGVQFQNPAMTEGEALAISLPPVSGD
jgi:alkaline phosphatase